MFLDSNVLVYAFSSDPKTEEALRLLELGGIISIQSLNEFANVARRKLRMDWEELRTALRVIRIRCAPPIILDEPLHTQGLDVAERYRLSVYDAMIVAAALVAGCETLYSEDMHAGLVVDGRLTIVNPFDA
ncbi:MAG TPA: PIN domain-containing protein [Sphingomonas sp.]